MGVWKLSEPKRFTSASGLEEQNQNSPCCDDYPRFKRRETSCGPGDYAFRKYIIWYLYFYLSGIFSLRGGLFSANPVDGYIEARTLHFSFVLPHFCSSISTERPEFDLNHTRIPLSLQDRILSELLMCPSRSPVPAGWCDTAAAPTAPPLFALLDLATLLLVLVEKRPPRHKRQLPGILGAGASRHYFRSVDTTYCSRCELESTTSLTRPLWEWEYLVCWNSKSSSLGRLRIIRGVEQDLITSSLETFSFFR